MRVRLCPPSTPQQAVRVRFLDFGFTHCAPPPPSPPKKTTYFGQSLASDTSAVENDQMEGRNASHVLRLSNEGAVTSDAGCGRLERMRRENARALHFRASVYVNGSKVNEKIRLALSWIRICVCYTVVRLQAQSTHRRNTSGLQRHGFPCRKPQPSLLVSTRLLPILFSVHRGRNHASINASPMARRRDHTLRYCRVLWTR